MAVRTFPSFEVPPGGLDAFPAEPVSLAGLKRSSIALEWFEAVAIVQELCRSLSDSTIENGTAGPNASNVTIDRTGSVTVTGTSRNHSSSVRQLGELLRSLLPDDVPVPLRLAVSQSVSTPPFYASLTTFSQALEYFERPNRSALILEVYQRWERRPLESRKQPDVLSEGTAPVPPKLQRARVRLPRWFVLLSVVLGTISLLTITMALLLPARTETAAAQSPANPILAAGNSVVEKASSIASAVISSITVAPTPDMAGDVKAPEPVRRASPTPVIQRLASPMPPAVPVAAVVHGPNLNALHELRSLKTAQLSNAVSTTENPGPNDQTTSGNVYSDVDVDVEPPVAVYPQIPSARFGPPEQDAAIFDVVIDRAGNVESAKLRQAPTSMGNAILLTIGLSAAKAWRFQPAMREGQPVKYRKTIWMPAR